MSCRLQWMQTVYWETGCIVPAILSDPLMAVTVDLVANEKAAPSITRVSYDTTPDKLTQYMTWTQYFKVLFNEAPKYERAIQAGEDARHLWCAIQAWRGDDPEGYFGDLGAWAERRMKELDIGQIIHQLHGRANSELQVVFKNDVHYRVLPNPYFPRKLRVSTHPFRPF